MKQLEGFWGQSQTEGDGLFGLHLRPQTRPPMLSFSMLCTADVNFSKNRNLECIKEGWSCSPRKLEFNLPAHLTQSNACKRCKANCQVAKE